MEFTIGGEGGGGDLSNFMTGSSKRLPCGNKSSVRDRAGLGIEGWGGVGWGRGVDTVFLLYVATKNTKRQSEKKTQLDPRLERLAWMYSYARR